MTDINVNGGYVSSVTNISNTNKSSKSSENKISTNNTLPNTSIVSDNLKVENSSVQPKVSSISFIGTQSVTADTLIDDAHKALNDAKQKIAIWSLSIDKANLLVTNKVSNKNTLVNVQGEMVSARNEAIKARKDATIAVEKAIDKVKTIIKTVGVSDNRGNELYQEYRSLVKEFDNTEERHTSTYDKLCKLIGSLFTL